MLRDIFNDRDDPVALLPELSQRLDDVRQARNELDEELMNTELSINEFIGALDGVGQRLKRIKVEPKKAASVQSVTPSMPVEPSSSVISGSGGMTLDEFKSNMGTILQGSLDAVSDKLSGKIQAMLKELGTLSGPARDLRIQEYQQSGEYASVDFSSMYKNQTVQSNLGEVGVEEKETKSIESSLERLRKMRGLKPKTDASPNP
ncbi:MAG: hypothetical protein HQL17_03005 [Candidatus Omnitrophica bacterium]|nr:hypothetical protein [Candidatus Omnitrophota bacterium]